MTPTQFDLFLSYRDHALNCLACERSRTLGTTPQSPACQMSLVRYYVAASEFAYVVAHFDPNLIEWVLLND
jgi:hypothetical protein